MFFSCRAAIITIAIVHNLNHMFEGTGLSERSFIHKLQTFIVDIKDS